MNISNAVKLPKSELARLFSTVPAAKSPKSSKPKRAPAVYRNGQRVELAPGPGPRAVRCAHCGKENGPFIKISDSPSVYRCERHAGVAV